MDSKDVGIIGWQKNSFIDFPKKISTVLFFRRCNLRCPYCHNPDIVLNRLPFIDFDEIVSFLEKRRKIIEGVVLTGGEPTLHTNLSEIVSSLRKMGFAVKIDSNGLNPEVIEQIRPDYFALDVKTDPHRYAELGCKDANAFEKIVNSIKIVKSMGIYSEIRITVAPKFVDAKILSYIAELCNGVANVYLQPLVVSNELLDNSLKDQDAYSSEILDSFRAIFIEKGISCQIRNR